jgi:ketosteroid isomerase-like protein
VTPEDVELIRSLYDAMSRRDLEALQAFADANPDFEWQPAPDEPDPSVMRGGRRTLACSRELFATFEEARECAPQS